MKEKQLQFPTFAKRDMVLSARRNLKMARSAHAYVRGNTRKFYEWLEAGKGKAIPLGPPVWICGDCHVGNLGPLANVDGRIDIQIRDLDQTVIGNPAHDLLRLGLSLATAARGSDLSGVTTAKMLEQLVDGYEQAFSDNADEASDELQHQRPECIKIAMRRSLKRSWKELAKERIEDIGPQIPLGKRFWPLSKQEQAEIKRIFQSEKVRELATSPPFRDNSAPISVLDAAYWIKGCSSLGLLRFAVLLGIGKAPYDGERLCLIDVKEAIAPAAPRYHDEKLPRDNGARVIGGARILSPNLGRRMLATHFLKRSVFLRELMPQDLQLEIGQLTRNEALKAARFLAMVVGKAHVRQMDSTVRKAWCAELQRHRSKTLDAPSWLWSSIVELLMIHEGEYLEHCRRYALNAAHSDTASPTAD